MDLDQMREALKRGTFKTESETKSNSISPAVSIPVPQPVENVPNKVAPPPRTKEIVYSVNLRCRNQKSDKEYVVTITADTDEKNGTEYKLSAKWGRTGKLNRSQDKYATYSKEAILGRAHQLIASKIKEGYTQDGDIEYTLPQT